MACRHLRAALKSEGDDQRAGAVCIERDFPARAVRGEFGRRVRVADAFRSSDGMSERRETFVHDRAMQRDGSG